MLSRKNCTPSPVKPPSPPPSKRHQPAGVTASASAARTCSGVNVPPKNSANASAITAGTMCTSPSVASPSTATGVAERRFAASEAASSGLATTAHESTTRTASGSSSHRSVSTRLASAGRSASPSSIAPPCCSMWCRIGEEVSHNLSESGPPNRATTCIAVASSVLGAYSRSIEIRSAAASCPTSTNSTRLRDRAIHRTNSGCRGASTSTVPMMRKG